MTSTLLLLTDSPGGPSEVLAALDLLPHRIETRPCSAAALLDTPRCDAVLLDARHDLAGVRGLCRVIRHTSVEEPLIVVVTEGGLAAVGADWGVDDVVLTTAGPAEVDARLRLAAGRLAAAAAPKDAVVGGGGLTVDEASYSARIDDRSLELTFKEFELVKFLAQHPGRVFTRQQLLDEVWGFDYFGGTRTVDVHVRRLRAKLGPEHERLIGTVRNVGYRFMLPSKRRAGLTRVSAGEAGPSDASPVHDPGRWASR
ncbi:MAG: winged helix-turn-helix domain-containing protein [Nocardioidaceae bacterium]